MKRFFSAFVGVFMHIWFYLIMFVFTLIIAPFLLFFGRIHYSVFFWLARNIWARGILYGSGIFPRIKFEVPLEKGRSYVLVANHTGMPDIMLMYMVSKEPFVFVGKKELAKYPVFGYFYKRVSILVDRKDWSSRHKAYEKATNVLKKGTSVCIFPEGGIPKEDTILASFKDGAFRMAIENKLPIVSMTFLDIKKRLPYALLKGSPGISRVKVHAPLETFDKTIGDKKQISLAVRNKILQDLEYNTISSN